MALGSQPEVRLGASVGEELCSCAICLESGGILVQLIHGWLEKKLSSFYLLPWPSHAPVGFPGHWHQGRHVSLLQELDPAMKALVAEAYVRAGCSVTVWTGISPCMFVCGRIAMTVPPKRILRSSSPLARSARRRRSSTSSSWSV